MSSYADKPILKAILALTGRGQNGKPLVITPTAVAKKADVGLNEVKRVLEANKASLATNEAGKMIGVSLLRAASSRKLVIMVTKKVHGCTAFQTYSFGGEIVGRVNMDLSGWRDEATRIEGTLSKHGVPLCERLNDLPESVLNEVWGESPLANVSTPREEGSEPSRGM